MTHVHRDDQSLILKRENKMNKFTLTTLCLLLVASPLALASENGHLNQHHGAYVGVTAGPNLYYAGIISSDSSTSTGGFTGYGWSADVGYNFTNIFAVEGGFMQNYGSYSNGDNDRVSIHTNVPYLAARFNIPMGQRFSLITKIGGMYVSAHGTNHGKTEAEDMSASTPSVLLPYVGLGVSYAINKHIDVSVQYQGAVYGIASAGLLGAGLTYHF